MHNLVNAASLLPLKYNTPDGDDVNDDDDVDDVVPWQ
jgi:hypothetical protein